MEFAKDFGEDRVSRVERRTGGGRRGFCNLNRPKDKKRETGKGRGCKKSSGERMRISTGDVLPFVCPGKSPKIFRRFICSSFFNYFHFARSNRNHFPSVPETSGSRRGKMKREKDLITRLDLREWIARMKTRSAALILKFMSFSHVYIC